MFGLAPVVAFAQAPANFSEFAHSVINFILYTLPLISALALFAFTWGLAKFISKAGRPFAACLVAGEDGKVSFEFQDSTATVGES